MDRRPLKVQAGAVPAVYESPARDAPPSGGMPAVRDQPVRPPRQRRSEQDPFPLGYRYRGVRRADGREDIVQVALTPEDLMNPQEGDVLSDGFPHNESVLPVGGAMQRHLNKRPGLLVTRGVVLKLADGKNCAPDVAVLQSEAKGEDIDTSGVDRAIDLVAVKARLIFALEAVSTSHKKVEKKDTEDNVKRYAKHRVPEYVTYYPVAGGKAEKLTGRRLPEKDGEYKGKYRKIAPDVRQRVYSRMLDLELVIDPSSHRLVVYDATTGQRLLTAEEEETGRLEAKRLLAEESEARKKAEQARKAEAEARQEAEQEKQKAERLNREMMAELERLRARLACDEA